MYQVSANCCLPTASASTGAYSRLQRHLCREKLKVGQSSPKVTRPCNQCLRGPLPETQIQNLRGAPRTSIRLLKQSPISPPPSIMEAHSSNPPKRDMHPKQSATAMAKGAAKPNRFRRNFVYSIVFGGCCIFLPFLASNTASARYINTPTILFITSIFLFYNSGIRTAIISTFVGRRIQDEAVPPGHQRVFWINVSGCSKRILRFLTIPRA